LVIDCYSRELLGWHLSRSGRSRTAEAALEQALIARYGCLGKVSSPFLLRSDNGLVFTSRSYTALFSSLTCAETAGSIQAFGNGFGSKKEIVRH
jgi:putative transposase